VADAEPGAEGQAGGARGEGGGKSRGVTPFASPTHDYVIGLISFVSQCCRGFSPQIR
jgi:hypothetical protein